MIRQLVQLLAGMFLLCVMAFPVSAFAAEKVAIGASSSWRGKAIRLPGLLYRPAGKKNAPVVILMHGCGGLVGAVTPALKGHARYFNRNGFAALILDSFGPRGLGGGKTCSNVPELTRALNYRQRDARDAARWLKKQTDIDGGNIFVMGQSNGGSVVINLAQAGGFRAIASYYPWCGVLTPGQPRSPLIVFGGGRDDWTPPDRCRKHKQGSRYSYVHYGSAAHSFDVASVMTSYLGYRLGYNGPADIDSRKRMIGFFRKHLR